MKLLFGLATLASVAFADITFYVVGYPSSSTGSFGVNIGGSITRLTSDESTFPVWSGSVPETDGNVQYSYVELSGSGTPVKSEGFTRNLQDSAKDTETLNEFFERPNRLGASQDPLYLPGHISLKIKAFKHKQIATIHVTAPAARIAELNASPYNDKDDRVDFRFINSKTIHSVRNVTLETSSKSSKAHSKQAFKFKFETDYNQTFFSRPNIKLRSMVMDPTMMREKFYINMLNSAGISTQQGAWVRLFINNGPYGMYLMVDDIKKSFLKQTVHGGDGKIERGSLIQMNTWNENKATLEYKSDKTSDYNTKTNYIYQNLGNNAIDDPLKELIDLMCDLNSFNLTATRDPVQYWNDTRIDLEGILRNMALEYLVGAFDDYWLSASNYFMHKNPSMGPSGKWQWLLTDFDGTFGNGAPTSRVPSYRNWYDFRSEGDRPLVRKLIIKNKEISGMFKQIFKELVSAAFKMQSLKPRIEMHNQMLSVDATWDYSLTRKSPGINNNFTFETLTTTCTPIPET